MPNWVTNSLVISGPEASLSRIVATHFPITKHEEFELPYFDFDSVIPMPPDLAVECASRGMDGWTVLYGESKEREAILERLDLSGLSRDDLRIALRERYPELFSLGTAYQENIRRYGHSTWIDWQIAHRGCKWDGSYASVDAASTPGRLRVFFETPDRPPLPVLAALSGLFPECRIVLTYHEHVNFRSGGATAVKGDLFLREEMWQIPYEEEFARRRDALPEIRSRSSSDPGELILALCELGTLNAYSFCTAEALPLLDEALVLQRSAGSSAEEIVCTLETIALCGLIDEKMAPRAMTSLREAICLRTTVLPPDCDNLTRLYFDWEDLETLCTNARMRTEEESCRENGEKVRERIIRERARRKS